MAIIINVPGVASDTAGWATIPSVPASYPLDGLVSYLAVQDAPINSEGRVSSFSRWVGSDNLDEVFADKSPTVEALSGVEMLRTTDTTKERLVASAEWVWGDATGMTILFPVKVETIPSSYGTMFKGGSFTLRVYNDGGTPQIQVRQATDSGTPSLRFDYPFTSLSIFAISFDETSGTVKIYKDGTLVVSNDTQSWGSIDTSEIPVFGAEYNDGTFALDAYYGDFVRYDTALSDADIARVSSYLSDKFSIA